MTTKFRLLLAWFGFVGGATAGCMITQRWVPAVLFLISCIYTYAAMDREFRQAARVAGGGG